MYPNTPGYEAHSDTSKAAAAGLSTQASMEDDILKQLEGTPQGLIADELWPILQISHKTVHAGTIAARLRGMELNGMIRKIKQTRKTRNNKQAHVWKHPKHATPDEVMTMKAKETKAVEADDKYKLALIEIRDELKASLAPRTRMMLEIAERALTV